MIPSIFSKIDIQKIVAPVFDKVKEMGQFIFPMPEYIMTPYAEERSQYYKSQLGYNVTDKLKDEVQQLQGQTLTVYKNSVFNTFNNLNLVLIVSIIFVLLLFFKGD